MAEITIDGVKYVPAPVLSGRVLVRCRNAGVHVGTMSKREGGVLRLDRANRIWRWRGAFTLSEVATRGVDRTEHTRIASEVPWVDLTESDVAEVIPVSEGVDLSEVHND